MRDGCAALSRIRCACQTRHAILERADAPRHRRAPRHHRGAALFHRSGVAHRFARSATGICRSRRPDRPCRSRPLWIARWSRTSATDSGTRHAAATGSLAPRAAGRSMPRRRRTLRAAHSTTCRRPGRTTPVRRCRGRRTAYGRVGRHAAANLLQGSRCCTTSRQAYYAHPSAWNEIGFGGPASPRGYVRMDFNRRDPWEARGWQQNGREATAMS